MVIRSLGLVLGCVVGVSSSFAGDIFASAAPSPGANGLYRIDPQTGVATLLATMPLLGGLAASPDGRLLGWQNGQLVEINPVTGVLSAVGFPAGVNATGFDVLSDGRAFIVGGAQTSSAQLYQVNLTDGSITPVGDAGALNASIDAALGLAPGTSRASIFSLGSVGNDLYGINGESGRTNLVRIDTTTAQATVLGPANALPNANGGGWGGFASLTGVDLDNDGTHDALFGGVNFAPGGSRAGAVARYNLVTGSWTPVGSGNAPLIYFGMASVPGTPCDTIDFNGNSVFPEDQDVIDFFTVLAGGECPTSTCNDIDFNNNGVFPEDQDVIDFFTVLAGGLC